MAYHHDERGKGNKPCGWLWAAAQWPPQPPYPFVMTGQG